MNRPNIYMMGAPASGKTMLSLALIRQLHSFIHLHLDEDVASVCFEEQIVSYPLDDEVIDTAVSRLLMRSNGKSNIIVEIPYHDYINLIISKKIDIENQFIVVVDAPLHTLILRNMSRSNRIPDKYIERCFIAVRHLLELLSACPNGRWMYLDTQKCPLNVAASSILSNYWKVTED